MSSTGLSTWPRLTEELTAPELALIETAFGVDNGSQFRRVLQGASSSLTAEETSECLTDMLYMMWIQRFNRYDSTDVLRTQSRPSIDTNTAVLPLHLGRLALAAGPSMKAWNLYEATSDKYAFLTLWRQPDVRRVSYWSSAFLDLVRGQGTSIRQPGARASWCLMYWAPLSERPWGASEVLLEEHKQRLRGAAKEAIERAEAAVRAKAIRNAKVKKRLAVAAVLSLAALAGTTALLLPAHEVPASRPRARGRSVRSPGRS